MSRRAPSVLFAVLLLVAQLLAGVMSAGAATHDGATHCAGCPGVHSGGMSHDSAPGDAGCGSHCSHNGSMGHRHGCGSHCKMAGNSHCGSTVGPAIAVSALLRQAVTADVFGSDRRPVDLPDSPLFDFLRPPNHG